MKNVLKLEEAAMFFLVLIVLIQFKADWWVYLLLALGPDISMLGYAGGNRLGAVSYNLFHHKGIAVLLYLAGIWLNDGTGSFLGMAGIIMFGHASLDRMLGYGLKLKEGFSYTHLGRIGKRNTDTDERSKE
jgi:hypothetical protein